ncbi:succinate dehydrogenase, hydrophobic membrane anchor protein [Sphingomonas sp. AX6]|uniref:succinate dehydrogenase, hydrophobic membrane anchor protein n=1 Tax=Sphingomonas sp. AX6 TaxID=2653171 RepID=UPI0012EFC841|nr:succinate dehydrogenase, hydrophobic membrane anchor protein [Sphingomonas sp. AX6]VXC83257.1 Succinate dehydrogenase hydrophobic membrane anchor protein [Sphingomonas sp. AX6]
MASTELGRVRGLGSAKHGAHHWWTQRMTAAANLILLPWFVASLVMLPAYDYATMAAWMGSAWVAIPLVLLIANLFYHIRLGLQVVIEDYQHGETRIVLMLLLNAFVFIAAATGIFSVLRLAFTGAAA